jgi:Putative zinc-finger
MSGHVDAESLALYAEGELSHRRAAKVRAHLAGCADCAATVAALSEVTAQLSHVPAPPVPAAVAARLDAALSAESARRAAAPVPAGAPQPRPPRRNPLRSPAALRILAATGVAVVVAGGVGYAIAQSGSSGPASTASGAAPAASHRSPEAGTMHSAKSGTGSPRNKPQLLPGAISGGSGAARVVQSGTDYRTATLGHQAKSEVARSKITGGQLLSTLPITLHNCVNSVAGHQAVLLVDRALYNQHAAVMIVVANTGAPDRVIAVTPSCSRLASATVR